MIVNIARSLLLVMLFASLLVNANLHGKPQTGTHNFWPALVIVAIIWVLLYFGNALPF